MCNIDTDSSYVLVYLYGVLCCDVSQNACSIFLLQPLHPDIKILFIVLTKKEVLFMYVLCSFIVIFSNYVNLFI